MDLIERLPNIATDFLDAAMSAFDQAVIEGRTPARWRMSKALYDNLQPGSDWYAEATRVRLGSVSPYRLANLPILVDVGAHRWWKLECDGGDAVEPD